MKENKYFLNTALALVLGLALAAAVLVRTFAPLMIIPELNGVNLVLISLAALVLDHYVVPNSRRCWICVAVLSALTFGLLPFAACFVGAIDAGWLALKGGVIFTITALLFTSIQDRLSSGPAAKAAPLFSAVGLYLAAQCLMGII